jgi:hypothetical protein
MSVIYLELKTELPTAMQVDNVGVLVMMENISTSG